MALQFKCNILGINKYIFIKYTTVNSLQKTDVKRLHGTVHLDQTGRVYNLTQSNSACRSKKCNQKYGNWQGFFLTGINLGICRALSPVVMHNKFWKYYMKDDSWGVEWTKYRQKLYLKCKEIDLERTYDVKRYQKYMQFSNWIQTIFILSLKPTFNNNLKSKIFLNDDNI